ncbi:MAG: helix-turn-helix transcriptional regulator [Clostridia bacterium]|nr:helix-turn-helix transcriptional regulator [Clostridia bacterium]
MENKIASRIYELRKQINLSQSELAKNIGASQKAIDFWEKGINEPKASYIISLAKFFDVSADFLLGLED